jgi:hypothetical protein
MVNSITSNQLVLWQVRNTEVNGTDPGEGTPIWWQKLIEEIICSRNQYPEIPIETPQLINKSRHELEILPTSTVATYLYGVKLIVKVQCWYTYSAPTNTISQYFAPIQPTTHTDSEDKSELDPGESY